MRNPFRTVQRWSVGFVLSACVATSLVVVAPGSSATLKQIPKSLMAAIENTMRAHGVEVSTSFRVLSPSVEKSSSTALLDFQYPDRVESQSRTIDIKGRLYGSSIYIGRTIYVRWPFSGATIRYTKSTLGSKIPESSEEQALAFYPLLFALKATSFTKNGNSYRFSSGTRVHGVVTIVNNMVRDSDVIYHTQPIHGYPSYIDRQVANYSRYGHVSKIVPPPKSRVH
jgi:hypothetical protein